MRPLYDAIMGRLSPLGWPVHFVEVPRTTDGQVPRPPYVVVWGPSSPLGGEDDRLVGERRDVDARIGVTSVAGTTEGVLIVQEAVRGALCPTGRTTHLPAEGWAAWLAPFDSRGIQIDRDVTYAGTSSHPAYGVDLYHLTATPTS